LRWLFVLCAPGQKNLELCYLARERFTFVGRRGVAGRWLHQQPTKSTKRPASLVAQALLLGPTLCALTGLGEEAGWRGLLFHALDGWGFWRRSWMIGLLWGVWHVPLVFEGYGYPNHRVLGTLLLLVFTLLASPLYVFLRIRSGSILAPAVCHGCFSASMLLTFAPIAGGSELTSGLLALPGILVMLAVNLALFLRVRRESSRNSAAPTPSRTRATAAE